MNLFDATVPIFVSSLHNLEAWLDKATAHAEQREFDPELFALARLAPDQMPLARQVGAACDTAKFAAAKLAGTEAPSHPDTETTLAEIRARIASCVAFLETLERAQFVGAEDREVSHAWMQDRHMRGGDYLDYFALPNFHFHTTTAYAILRHGGVQLGKRDFLGNIPLR